MDDHDLVRTEAVNALRRALQDAATAGDALRWCWYRNPMFSSALFTEAVQQFFGPGCDVRVITRFVARIASSRPPTGVGFASREAEAFIRAMLGEVALLDEVHPAQFSYAELGIAVLERLFAEWRPGSAELDALFARAESVGIAAQEVDSTLRPAESDWFAAGMHESPFAFPTSAPAPAEED
ncbi:MAG TPA: hypothetical protein VGH27_30185 [Streptosporangiaceae bacterium]